MTTAHALPDRALPCPDSPSLTKPRRVHESVYEPVRGRGTRMIDRVNLRRISTVIVGRKRP